MPPVLPPALRALLVERFGALHAVAQVSGGDTSSAARVDTPAGRLFVKWGRGHAARSYAPEADGLRALATAAPESIVVPEVLAQAPETGDAPGYLALPWLAPGRPSPRNWGRFGESLAALHAAPVLVDGYGWTRDNYLGLAPQRNGVHDEWPAFYAAQRLDAIRAHVRGLGRWQITWDEPLDALIADLPGCLPAKPAAALVHGDLWRGNAHALADGRFALIDPAVYVGHGEVDLALSEMFGGFPREFYEGYRSVTPEVPGYPDRRDVYQLYHWMMHLAVSAGYGAQVGASLRGLA